MRDYAKVSPQFWIGDTGRRIRDAGRDCQVAALYLLTCPSSNMIGLYYLPLSTIQHETGLSRSASLRALQRLHDIGFATWDQATETVFVVEMAAHQLGQMLKEQDKKCKGAERAWQAMRMSPFYRAFYNRYRLDYHLPKPFNGRGLEGASKALRSKEKEQEKEHPLPSQGGDEQGSGVCEGTSVADVIPFGRAAR